MSTFDIAAWLLVMAAAIGLVNDRWLGLPRNLALLLGALLTACVVIFAHRLLPFGHSPEFWRHRMQAANLSGVLLDGVLALLLFAGSMHVDPRALRERAWAVAGLATGSVMIATFLFGLGFHAATILVGDPVPLIWCCVLGAILAPTDAVVVEGLLQHVPMPARLRATIAGESLFNDGAAVVLVVATLAIAAGQPNVIGHGRLVTAMAEEVAGGAAIGWVAGAGAAWLSQRLKDRSLELIISLAVALGSYRLATAFGFSGPIAVVASGLAYRRAPWVTTGGAASGAGGAPHPAQTPHPSEVVRTHPPDAKHGIAAAASHPTPTAARTSAAHPHAADIEPHGAAASMGTPSARGSIQDRWRTPADPPQRANAEFPGGPTHIAANQPHVATSWAVIDDLLNTFLFLLMGFQILAVDLPPAVLVLLPLAFLVVLAARAISVGLPVLLQPLSWRGRMRSISVLTWTGLRGGISIALALSLPDSPYRDLLLGTGYGVVIVTVVVQGLSVGPVLRWMYAPPAAAATHSASAGDPR